MNIRPNELESQRFIRTFEHTGSVKDRKILIDQDVETVQRTWLL